MIQLQKVSITEFSSYSSGSVQEIGVKKNTTECSPKLWFDTMKALGLSPGFRKHCLENVVLLNDESPVRCIEPGSLSSSMMSS